MSREAYVAPTSAFNTGTTVDPGPGLTTQYICGDCNQKVLLKQGDGIRCKECGHRILYKERTKRMVQFEAR